MNKLLIYTLLALSALCTANGQDPQPQEKKIVFDQKGNIYVNKELGIYVWLSTSPDNNSQKIRLKSDSSKSYSNPMYFDTEGYNTVRSPSAVDTVSKRTIYPLRDIIFEVYADGQSPSTACKIISGNSRYRNGKLYYGGNTRLYFKAKDHVAGLSKTYYSINNDAFLASTDTLKFHTDGENKVKYYSVDRVGNREKPKEKIFVIDNTAPVSNYEILDNDDEKYLSSNSKIKLSAEDEHIGVKAIYYRINNSSTKIYSTPIPSKQLNTKNGTLSYWSVDFLNNKEIIRTIGGKDNPLVEN